MMTGAAVWLIAFALFLRAYCPTLTHWDAAELLVVGRGLDIGHPPGYPLLACIVRLAILLPVGGTMVRASLVSVGASAAAVALVPVVARRLGASRGASLLGAAMALACPFLWEQATTLEKHPLHLAIAMAVAATALGPAARWLPSAFGLGVGLAHHPLTIMLAPLLGPTAWRRWHRPEGRLRAFILAIPLMLVPMLVHPMYSAIRAAALAQPGSPPGVADWGEPAHPQALLDYLTVREYSSWLGRAVRQERPTLRQTLAYYPRALGFAGLIAALIALFLGVAASRPEALAVAVAIAFTFAFCLFKADPPAAAGAYHLQAFLLLAAAVPAAAGVMAGHGLRRAEPWIAVVLACVVAAEAAGRLRPAQLDASRQFACHDAYAAVLAATPRKGVFLSASILDFFAVRHFQLEHARRTDLTVVHVPIRTPAGFSIYRRWRSRVMRILQGATLGGSEEDSAAQILRRLVLDNDARYCFVASPFAGYILPLDLFATAGPLYATIGCTSALAGGSARSLPTPRSFASRGWFSDDPYSANHYIATFLSGFMQRAGYNADLHHDPERAERLLRTSTRLAPESALAWLALARWLDSHGRATEARAELERAATVEPGSPMVWADLLDLSGRSDSAQSIAILLDRFFRLAPFRDSFSVPKGLASLAMGDLRNAHLHARRALAEAAVAAARATPCGVALLPRRIALASLAADLEPGWPDAQREAADAFTEAGDQARAGEYLIRLRRAETGGVPGARLESQLSR